MLILFGEQAPHTDLPQQRQWCRRRSSVNRTLQSSQWSPRVHVDLATAVGAVLSDCSIFNSTRQQVRQFCDLITVVYSTFLECKNVSRWAALV